MKIEESIMKVHRSKHFTLLLPMVMMVGRALLSVSKKKKKWLNIKYDVLNELNYEHKTK